MNVAGTITVDIRDTIALDQNVFDSTGTKVGTVVNIEYATGWLTVEANPLSDQAQYVPFRLITHIDPNELFLGATKDELRRDYSAPPPRTTSVQGEGGDQAATTTQPSGYDGAPLVVHQAKLSDLRDGIDTDFKVCTSDMVDLGRIREYDPATGLMVLSKGTFSKHDVVVPITLVDKVDTYMLQVVLIASEADVKRMTPVNLVRIGAQLAQQD